MANLTDMEELVSSIVDNDVKIYMREALTCYMTGAYRATIVLSYIALFDDILSKLKELGKVNGKARKIHNEVVQKKSDQEVFESDLINQLASNNLLNSLDSTFLDILRQLRNKAAHPSGHKPSAEEARFIFFESISRFLSKNILSTTQLADEILASMGDKNLFPSASIKDTAKVVSKELGNIHYETYPYLISKLLEKIGSDDSLSSKNARFFLNGMVYKEKDANVLPAIKKYVIEKKAKDEKYFITIISLITSNAKLLEGLDTVTYQRIKAIIQNRIKSVEASLQHTQFSHPVAFFVSIFKNCTNELIENNFSNELEQLFKKYNYSSYLATNAAISQYSKNLYIKILISEAGSSDFDTANYFARNVHQISDEISAFFNKEDSFKLIANVIKAGNYNAFGAKDMRSGKFSSISGIKDKAIELLDNDLEVAKNIYRDVFGSESDFDQNMNAFVR